MPVPVELTVRAPRAARPPRHLADLDPGQRREAVTGLGERAFRAEQLSRHYFDHLVDFAELDPSAAGDAAGAAGAAGAADAAASAAHSAEMTLTDVPRAARELLLPDLLPRLLTPVRHLTCDRGQTRKSVWRLFDGTLVESVLMRYPDRVTVCVSSQAGCGMGCPFCATGQAGLTRNLSTGEIVDQVVAAARALRRGEVAGGAGRVSNVVFMGMGEPLANYRAVLGAIRRLTDPAPDGLGMSQRGITVSTVGLVPAIDRLTEEGLQVRLAVSLHAPDDGLRDELVPVNLRWNVAEVLAAAWRYTARTGRRASIEYALIKDVNDQPWRADLLGRLLAGHLVHVNLIPLNPTPGSKWTASRPEDEREFIRRLRAHGLPVTLRDTRGREIDGACGQLAAATAQSDGTQIDTAETHEREGR